MLPSPFPVPSFRSVTETNLADDVLTDSDRKYMVQTLATMLMSYVKRPSLSDCLVISKALHRKFNFLGDEGSEVIVIGYICLCVCVYEREVTGSH